MAAKGLTPMVIVRRIWFDIFIYPYFSFILLLHNFGMMKFGSNKANRAKNEGITMLNQVLETWDEGMYCMMKLFLCGNSYFIYVSHVFMMMFDII